MRPDADILQSFQTIPDAEYRDQVTNNFYFNQPRPDLLRFTVAVNARHLYGSAGNVLSEIFSDGREKAFTNRLSADSRLLSAGLAEAWSRKFAEDVQAGDGA